MPTRRSKAKAKATPQPPVPMAYSYLRFSRPEQAAGHSEQRQIEDSRKYAEDAGLAFADEMADRGLSAYTGDNIKRGALKGFLDAIGAGHIAPGSVLIVENVDRLSRQDVLSAFQTIADIVNAGVKIVTLSPSAEYDREALNGGDAYQLIGQMQMAHSESQKKADRLRKVWKEKRRKAREGHELPTRCRPEWLDLPENATTRDEFVVLDGARETLTKLFELKLEGIGVTRITKALNQPGHWHAGEWGGSYVKKCLRNRATIGEYQPHKKVNGERVPDGDPIGHYYPTVVDPDLFHSVQALLKTPENRSGGRKDKCGNLFTYLATCPYCGGSMRYKDGGTGPKAGRKRLVCDNRARGIGPCVDAPARERTAYYDEIEATILTNCQDLRPDELLPNADDQARECKRLKTAETSLRRQIDETETQIANLVDRVATATKPSIAERYESRIAQLEDDQQELTAKLDATTAALAVASRDAASIETWQASLGTLLDEIGKQTDDAVALRLRLREHLRGMIERIETYTVGLPYSDEPSRRRKTTKTADGRLRAVVLPPVGEDIKTALNDTLTEPDHPITHDRRYETFLDHVAARRMSVDGRFYRMWMKTGACIDIVPDGSLASGMVLSPTGRWTIVEPDWDALWDEFASKHHDRKNPSRGKPATTC